MTLKKDNTVVFFSLATFSLILVFVVIQPILKPVEQLNRKSG